MPDFFFHGLDIYQILILAVSALLIGINKTGMPGLGLLPVALLTVVFPAKMSTGLQLVMLCMGDLMAVAYYRRKADWKLVLRLLPFTLIGLVAGTFAIHCISDAMMRPLIGWIVLFLCIFDFIRKKFIRSEKVPDSLPFAAAAGATAGFTTQVANAAGPVMSLYLLAMRLPKEKYMGTCSWFFLIMNYIKLPVFIGEGRITMESFRADLAMLPFLFLGGVIGILFIRKASQKTFELLIAILILLSGLKLVLSV